MFDTRRTAHCRGVAIFMRRLAPHLGLEPNRMALLGWVHDLGYLIGDTGTHAKDMGMLLATEGYEYADAVAHHGTDDIDCSDAVEVLLNIADMSIDGNGFLVSFDDRIEDVTSRWGADFVGVKQCRKVADLLTNTDEWCVIADVIVSMPEYRKGVILSD